MKKILSVCGICVATNFYPGMLFAQELEEYGSLEQMPKLEGKKMIIMINPKKK